MSAIRRYALACATSVAVVAGSTALAATASAAPAADPTAGAAQAALAAPAAGATPSGSDVLSLIDQANKTLRKLGIQPFLNPSVAFNCSAPTAKNPLGIVPAVGGSVAGPWSIPGFTLPEIPVGDPSPVKDGQTLFGFVPAGVSKDASDKGMQVAWFNANTGKGGFVGMGKAGATLADSYLAGLPDGPVKKAAATALATAIDAIAPAGTRLAPVKTEHGTVLSAVFGTVKNNERTCFFLPMLGVTKA